MVSLSEGQDPLGLNLRVSARLASQLLHCITSITQRARYYSFVPWAISAAHGLDENTKLSNRLRYIEKAFAASCILHHDGKACEGGGLVGSESLTKWMGGKRHTRIDVNELPFAQNPAFGIYIPSLGNMHLIQSEHPTEEAGDDENIQFVIGSDLTLTPLGQKIAAGYDQAVSKANPTGFLNPEKGIPADHLSKWGRLGGLCELSEGSADMDLLRDLMFNRFGLPEGSHRFRRDSLLLLLHLAGLAEKSRIVLGEWEFCDAIFDRRMSTNDDPPKTIRVSWPSALDDIAARWRMFDFHMYLTIVLENLFVCTVGEANRKRAEGFRLPELLAPLKTETFNRKIRALINVNYKGYFTDLTPNILFATTGLRVDEFSREASLVLEGNMPFDHPLSERSIQIAMHDSDCAGTPEALALSAVLCTTLCLRFLALEDTAAGKWLAGAVGGDPYDNVTVPVVIHDLRNHFSNPWQVTFGEWLLFLLDRFVVRLHLSLAYQKTGPLFSEDIDCIRGFGLHYDNPSYRNGRFPRAMRILEDLKLLAKDPETGVIKQSPAGKQLLREELAKGDVS